MKQVEFNTTLLDDLTRKMLQERDDLRNGKLEIDVAKALNESARNIISVQLANVQILNQILQREKLEIRVAELNVKARELFLQELSIRKLSKKEIEEALKKYVGPFNKK